QPKCGLARMTARRCSGTTIEERGAMNVSRRRLLSAMVASLAAPRLLRAEGYPARPVRVIVPYAPGGATDIVARPILQELSKRLGQQFYVENIPGAAGNIGTGQAAKAAPDGYTILFAYSSHVTGPAMFERLSYDPIKDFSPITLAVTSPAVLSVH